MREKRKPGRPAVGARKIEVNLDPITIERAKALGGGNVSKGLRDAFGVVDSYAGRVRALADDIEAGK